MSRAREVLLRDTSLAACFCEACGVYAARLAFRDGTVHAGRWCPTCTANRDYAQSRERAA